MRSALIALPLSLLACTQGEDATDDALPAGISTWSGNLEVGASRFLGEFELNVTGGDVEGTITVRDDPEASAAFGEGTFEVRGTHEPTSGLIALAPYAWTDAPIDSRELLGFIGRYDGAADELVGTIVDYATGDDNTLLGGPARATRTSGDGAPTEVGDGANALATGANPYTGTLRCTGPVRDVAGAIDYDGAGAVEGTITLGDPGLDEPIGTFAVTGVHNPTTGGLTLVPGLWTEYRVSVLSFFVNGTYDPGTGVYAGDQLTNVDACPRDLWSVTFE